MSEPSVTEPILVLVSESEFAKAEETFRSAPGMRCIPAPDAEKGMADAVRMHGARCVVLGPLPYRDGLYAALPRGGVIARFGVGHDGIDKAKATRAGLLCANTPGVLHDSVAEFAMLLILAAARHLPAMVGGMAAGVWRPESGTELKGRTLAVIGCGLIGGALVRIAGEGFGMKIAIARRADEFPGAVRGADFVSLHIPATPSNARFIDEKRLQMLESRAWLINTSRGAVLDERALYDALAARLIAGAALDVFGREPYVPDDPMRDLRALPNVILTPHAGSSTAEAGRRMAERALANIRAAVAGNFAAMDLLNPDVPR
jgi:phosphoglycerate dehydrogenase-like enzyme